MAERKLREPKTIDVVEAVANKGVVGKSFKKEAKEIMEALSKLEPSAVAEVEESLKNNGKYVLEIGANSYILTPDMLEVKRYQKTIYVEEYVPNVIEPSFGIGRIMYSIFEHNFKVRSDGGQRTVSKSQPDESREFQNIYCILFFAWVIFLSISLYLRLSLH